MIQASSNRGIGWQQFTLASLFELTTLCCLVAASTSAVGMGAEGALMLLALALHLRLGGLSLISLAAAFLIAALPIGTTSDTAFLRECAISLAAAAICAWYWSRSRAAGCFAMPRDPLECHVERTDAPRAPKARRAGRQ